MPMRLIEGISRTKEEHLETTIETDFKEKSRGEKKNIGSLCKRDMRDMKKRYVPFFLF